MRVLLDTNICISIINQRPGFDRALRRISGRSFGEICISAITVSELNYGVTKSAKRRENASALEEFFTRFELLDYPIEAASRYGPIRAQLENDGVVIGGNDLLIAAHASAIGASVATANVKEFQRVRGLKVLNWLT